MATIINGNHDIFVRQYTVILVYVAYAKLIWTIKRAKNIYFLLDTA